MTTFAQRQAELNKRLRESRTKKANAEKWLVEIRQGYTDKVLETHRFPTFEKAEKFYQARKSGYRFSGLGGRFQQYVTYPREVKQL